MSKRDGGPSSRSSEAGPGDDRPRRRRRSRSANREGGSDAQGGGGGGRPESGSQRQPRQPQPSDGKAGDRAGDAARAGTERESDRERSRDGRGEGGGGRERSGEGERSRGRGGRGRDGGGRGDGRRQDDRRESSPRDDRGSGDRRNDDPSESRSYVSNAKPYLAPEGVEIPALSEDNEFVGLGLVPAIAAAVEAKGYTQPTPIQSEAIPFILDGRDVIGSAQTGTGKTAAFCLPILQKLGSHGKLRCLILEPTRELALQVDEALRTYSKFAGLNATVIYGGVGYGTQRDAIASGLDIIVATPGRLLDHIEQRSFSLSEVEYLVLDEVDRMLDMGFLPDVKRIIGMCPKERQTLFFSATIPPELEKLTEWCLRDPHTIEIGRRRSAAETVSHAFYPVIESQKFDLLKKLLEDTNYDSVLVFCRTKHGADFVANRLEREKHKVAVMHSNRSQSERTEALQGFKSGKYELLVATDVAARGLDIQGVTHVINFDTPQHPEDYVHRIGRTGRAQSEGDAFTLLTEDEMKFAFAIERFIDQKVERKKVEGFDYQYSAVFASLEGESASTFRSRLYRGSKVRR